MATVVAASTLVSAAPSATPVPARGAVARIEALDFTKGALVVTMVVYHWLNYFVTLDWDVYRYLRFLTPSFILITGYLVTSVYGRKMSADPRGVRARLLARGAKLVVLFTVLNLLLVPLGAGFAATGRDSGWIRYLASVYVSGTGRAAFDVLAPIAYVLLLSPLVLELRRRADLAPVWLAAAALIVAGAASLTGRSSANLELVAMGFLGMALGTRLTDISGRIYRPAALMSGYAAYLVAITRWDVLFPLQIVGVCLTLAGMLWAGAQLAGRTSIAWVTELGKYSLLGYIVQVAILQVLKRLFGSVNLTGSSVLLLFVLTLSLTVASIYAVAFMRRRSVIADRAYRLVFT